MFLNFAIISRAEFVSLLKHKNLGDSGKKAKLIIYINDTVVATMFGIYEFSEYAAKMKEKWKYEKR